MTFRFPFQISRAVSKLGCLDGLLNKNQFKNGVQKHLNSTYVGLKKNWLKTTANQKKRNTVSLPVYPSRFSLQFRCNSTKKENRKKIRKQQKCQERKEVDKKLAFRQTTREECNECINSILVPDKCPELPRPKPSYDQTDMKWKHKNCKEEEPPERMDDIKGYKIRKKTLPSIKSKNCRECSEIIPTEAPKLVRPKSIYDASKLKWKYKKSECTKPEDDCPPRMDDVLGYKVTPKKLPKLLIKKDCQKCLDKPSSAPKLCPPKRRYDPATLEKRQKECVVEEPPERMDDIMGLKVEKKELPELQNGMCVECIDQIATHAPILVRPKRKYDPTKMKRKQVPVEIPVPRMDNILGYRVEKKSLPKLELDDCKECLEHVPTLAPKLIRPRKLYDESQMKWKHKEKVKVVDCKYRIDDIKGYTIKKKKLPPLTIFNDCTTCVNFMPTTAPKLKKPRKLYDESKFKWKHMDCKDVEKNKPKRMDDIKGCKVVKKSLPKLPVLDNCIGCVETVPTTAPKLTRPTKLFDSSEMKYKHKYPEEISLKAQLAGRMDNIIGYKVEAKSLPKLPLSKCPDCVNHVVTKSPNLHRLKPKYDPSLLKFKHKCSLKDKCKINPRMDDILGYTIKPKTLPKIPTLDCAKCINFVPTSSPKLKRLRRKFDPSKLEKVYGKECDSDMCNYNPPRLDDVQCWQPKRKKLPSFITNTQRRNYSTYENISKKYSNIARKLLKKDKENTTILNKHYTKFTKSNYKQVNLNIKENIENQSLELAKCLDHSKKTGLKFIGKNVDTKTTNNSYGENLDSFWQQKPSESNFNTIRNISLLQPQKQVSAKFYLMKPPPPPFQTIDPNLSKKYKKSMKKKHGESYASYKQENNEPISRKSSESVVQTKNETKVNPLYKCFPDKIPTKELEEGKLAEFSSQIDVEKKVKNIAEDTSYKTIKDHPKVSSVFIPSENVKSNKKEYEIVQVALKGFPIKPKAEKLKTNKENIYVPPITPNAEKLKTNKENIYVPPITPNPEKLKTEKRNVYVPPVTLSTEKLKTDKKVNVYVPPVTPNAEKLATKKGKTYIPPKIPTVRNETEIERKLRAKHNILTKLQSSETAKFSSATVSKSIFGYPNGPKIKMKSKSLKSNHNIISKTKLKFSRKAMKYGRATNYSTVGYDSNSKSLFNDLSKTSITSRSFSQSRVQKSKCATTKEPQKEQKNPCPMECSSPGEEVNLPDQSKSFWQRIRDYFKARPNCPGPDDWKKKELREKAEKAAEEAGLELCEKPKARCNVVVIDEDRNSNCKPKSDCCPKPSPKKQSGSSKSCASKSSSQIILKNNPICSPSKRCLTTKQLQILDRKFKTSLKKPSRASYNALKKNIILTKINKKSNKGHSKKNSMNCSSMNNTIYCQNKSTVNCANRKPSQLSMKESTMSCNDINNSFILAKKQSTMSCDSEKSSKLRKKKSLFKCRSKNPFEIAKRNSNLNCSNRKLAILAAKKKSAISCSDCLKAAKKKRNESRSSLSSLQLPKRKRSISCSRRKSSKVSKKNSAMSCSSKKSSKLSKKKSTVSCGSKKSSKLSKKKSTVSCGSKKSSKLSKKKSTMSCGSKKSSKLSKKKSTVSCGRKKPSKLSKKKSTISCGRKKSSKLSKKKSKVSCGRKKSSNLRKKKSTISCGRKKSSKLSIKKSTVSCGSKKSSMLSKKKSTISCGSKKSSKLSNKKSTVSCGNKRSSKLPKKKSTLSLCSKKSSKPSKKKSRVSCGRKKSSSLCKKKSTASYGSKKSPKLSKKKSKVNCERKKSFSLCKKKSTASYGSKKSSKLSKKKSRISCDRKKSSKLSKKKSTVSCGSKKSSKLSNKKSTVSCGSKRSSKLPKKKSTLSLCSKKSSKLSKTKSTVSCGRKKSSKLSKKKSTVSCGSKKSKKLSKTKSTSSCGSNKSKKLSKTKSTSSCGSEKSTKKKVWKCGSEKKVKEDTVRCKGSKSTKYPVLGKTRSEICAIGKNRKKKKDTKKSIICCSSKSLKSKGSRKKVKVNCSRKSLKSIGSRKKVKVSCSRKSLKSKGSKKKIKVSCSKRSIKSKGSRQKVKVSCSKRGIKSKPILSVCKRTGEKNKSTNIFKRKSNALMAGPVCRGQTKDKKGKCKLYSTNTSKSNIEIMKPYISAGKKSSTNILFQTKCSTLPISTYNANTALKSKTKFEQSKLPKCMLLPPKCEKSSSSSKVSQELLSSEKKSAYNTKELLSSSSKGNQKQFDAILPKLTKNIFAPPNPTNSVTNLSVMNQIPTKSKDIKNFLIFSNDLGNLKPNPVYNEKISKPLGKILKPPTNKSQKLSVRSKNSNISISSPTDFNSIQTDLKISASAIIQSKIDKFAPKRKTEERKQSVVLSEFENKKHLTPLQKITEQGKFLIEPIIADSIAHHFAYLRKPISNNKYRQHVLTSKNISATNFEPQSTKIDKKCLTPCSEISSSISLRSCNLKFNNRKLKSKRSYPKKLKRIRIDKPCSSSNRKLRPEYGVIRLKVSKSRISTTSYVAKNRYFSTYSDILNRHKILRPLLTRQNKRLNQVHNASKNKEKTSTYLRLSNRYVGKIYKLKLTKIGVRNSAVQQNTNDPYTICHICKVVPRRKVVCQGKNSKIKSLNVLPKLRPTKPRTS